MSQQDRAKINKAAFHFIMHRDAPFDACSTCGSMFSWVETQQHHEKTHGECVVCGENAHLKDEESMKDHSLKHTKQKDAILLVNEPRVEITTPKSQDGAPLILGTCDKVSKREADFPARPHTKEPELSHPIPKVSKGVAKPPVRRHAILEHAEFHTHRTMHAKKAKYSSMPNSHTREFHAFIHKKQSESNSTKPTSEGEKGVTKSLIQCLHCHEMVARAEFCAHTYTHSKTVKYKCPSRLAEPNPCELCDISLLNQKQLENHMEKHKTQETFECSECPKKFLSASGLKFHMYEHCFVYKCDVCLKKFKFSGSFQKHMGSHSKEEIEKAKRNKPENEIEHHTYTHSKTLKYKCSSHRAEPNPCTHTNKPKWTHSVKPFVRCPQCKVMVERAEFRAHMDTHSKTIKYKSTSSPKYNACTGKNQPESSNSESFEDPKVPAKCLVRCLHCHAMVKHTEFCTHMATHTNECSPCFAEFDDELKNHILKHHKEGICPKIHEKEPLCPECGAHFSDRQLLKAHLKVHEARTCELCDNNFPSKSAFEQHMESHRTEKNYECTECPKKYLSAKRLQSHTKEHNCIHYECPECAKKYPSAKTLEFHMKEHNSLDESIAYKKNLVQSSICHKHMETHSKVQKQKAKKDNPERNPSGSVERLDVPRIMSKFTCEDCGYESSLYKDHLYHTMTHAKDKKFACVPCQKRFKTKSDFKQHLSTHQKPFHSCELCNQSFKQLIGLKKHMMSLHNK